MNSQNRRSRLGAFISLLSSEFSWEFDRDEFDDRFLLQKYVFFAERLGFPFPYRYNVYVFGAYSPSLAQDYYSEELLASPPQEIVNGDFDIDTFGELVRNKDARWLEIASTLVLYDERFQNLEPDSRQEKVLEKTREEKDATEKTTRQIYETLAKIGLIGRQ